MTAVPTSSGGALNIVIFDQKRWSEIACSLKSSTGRARGTVLWLFLLAVLGALLGAAVTMTGTQTYGACVAVITTISDALAAHALAQRYEQLTISYPAAAQRFQSAVGRRKVAGAGNPGDLVEACENILLEENQGWIAGADQR